MASETFRDKRGRDVIIDADEDAFACFVREKQSGHRIGEIAFRFIEGGGRADPDSLLIVNMHLEGLGGAYKRAGIGRRCLELALEYFGADYIVAGRDDGTSSDDGSHLTGDAPRFVRAMRREGLILEDQRDEPSDD